MRAIRTILLLLAPLPLLACTRTAAREASDARAAGRVSAASRASAPGPKKEERPRKADKGRLLGAMWNTYYYLASHADHPGRAHTTLRDAGCRPIARVTRGFADSVCVEGSGLLADGRVINYARRCKCGHPCKTGETLCFVVLDRKKFPWGMGSRLNPLVPLRSWAVDNRRIPHGTRLYAEQWDGVEIPAVDGLGGFVHDGCFRADDVGTSIRGDHFDLFAGTRAMWQALEKLFETRSSFTVHVDPPRCRGGRP
jgi:3D (Asp-Asp-Asp) domain-containing protein